MRSSSRASHSRLPASRRRTSAPPSISDPRPALPEHHHSAVTGDRRRSGPTPRLFSDARRRPSAFTCPRPRPGRARGCLRSSSPGTHAEVCAMREPIGLFSQSTVADRRRRQPVLQPLRDGHARRADPGRRPRTTPRRAITLRDCRASLGPVKPRRFASTPFGAGGLDRPSGPPRICSYEMAGLAPPTTTIEMPRTVESPCTP